jgi:membrane-associated PAP2 superfamily phosphatase
MTAGKHVLLSIIALSLTLIWFETTSTDIWLQNLLFDNQNQTWLLHNPGQIVSLLFYDGIKTLLVLSAVTILISLLLFKHAYFIRKYHQGLRIVFISLIAVPSVIGILKATTNVACPRDITVYGGNIPYVKVFESYPAELQPTEKQQCFPAGHASGGFALMSLYFLFHSTHKRRLALLFGLSVGWLMGGYKMIIGHHFLSHTMITMISAWLLINLIVIVDAFMVAKIKQHFIKPRGYR